MQSTSVHLGLAADSVAQADYNMASVAAERGGDGAEGDDNHVEIHYSVDFAVHYEFVDGQPPKGGGQLLLLVDQEGRIADDRCDEQLMRDMLRDIARPLTPPE